MPRIKGLIGRGSVMATVPDTTGIAKGGLVTGPGIAPGTTVAEIRGPESVQLSQGATDNLLAELVFEDAPKVAPAETVDPAFRAFDHNGNGRPGGSLPKGQRATKPKTKPAAKPAKKPAAKPAVTTPTRKKK